jgi:hypothetical protein
MTLFDFDCMSLVPKSSSLPLTSQMLHLGFNCSVVSDFSSYNNCLDCCFCNFFTEIVGCSVQEVLAGLS